MKKKISIFFAVMATVLAVFAFNSQPTFAKATGWHHGRYYVRNFNNKVVVDKIDLVGSHLIDSKGRAHKLKLTKRGNHTRAANRVARIIARYSTGKTDLERVDKAAYYVSLFADRDWYTMKGRYYDKAYGVFIAKRYSCAGTADALQKVLHYMGFKARHVNKNKYTHQWCTLKMDGHRGYADGQAGFANYGKYFTKKNQIILTPTNSIYVKKINGMI